MKSFAALIVTTLVIVLVGVVLWFAAESERRLADAEYTLVTLRYERAAADLQSATSAGLLDPLLRRISRGADDERAIAQYWNGDYQALNGSEVPKIQLLAANAEYRALRAAGGPWQSVVGRLDAIAKRYADIVRADAASEEAAFNYEFVVRLRAAVLKSKQPLPAGDPTLVDLTVHGEAGAPPRDTDAKKFKMIVPMLPDERQEAEEAGRTGQKLRKG
jgi:hypothetical protein